MRKRVYVLSAAAVLAIAAGAAGSGNAATGAGDDKGGEATTPAEQHAVAAALQVTGVGTANAVERDSESGATWEVEVARKDGSTVDVRLNADYGLVVVQADKEGHRGDKEHRRGDNENRHGDSHEG
jgi:uncharacterized membrane protein YkoI